MHGCVGAGATATVWKALDADGTPRAVKVLRYDHPEARVRLEREAARQAQVRHVNVVCVIGLIDIDGVPALVSEFVDGPDLATWLDGSPGVVARDAVAAGLLAGLAAIHAEGIVHRDIKPSNILVMAATDGSPVPRIADFGLTTADPAARRVTQTMAGFGTPAYAAPEQLEDAGGVGPAADLWSLGCVLFELAWGRRAFPGDDLAQVVARVRSGTSEHLRVVGWAAARPSSRV